MREEITKAIPVMESFLTIQGEGFHQGSLAYFIRLAGCDVGCSWCDVKESWEVTENQWREIPEIVREFSRIPVKMTVITGGEPLMYDLSELTKALHKSGIKIHLETSGAYELSGNFDWICLSPKKFKKPLENIYAKADELKIIVSNRDDLRWAEREALKVRSDCILYLQAEWSKREKLYPSIYSYIASHPGWKISVQTHKYLGLP